METKIGGPLKKKDQCDKGIWNVNWQIWGKRAVWRSKYRCNNDIKTKLIVVKWLCVDVQWIKID